MGTLKIAESYWLPDQKLIVTHISGEVDKNDVTYWKETLEVALGQIPENAVFKIFVNQHGFEAADLDAHKHFRDIIPLTLAQYGWKVGYLGLFEEEAKQLTYSNRGEIRCAGAAHCHQDATKMELYERRFSTPNERFFTNPNDARHWIEALVV